jgi:hypothetical protein
MENKLTNRPLLERLTQADIVCRDCGERYGTYSVGCSSTWTDECNVCGETKGCTEVRDWGYLTKGINELKSQRPAEPFHNLTENFTPERKAKIKEQSKKVADYMASVGPIMNDAELEDCLTASYEQGTITLMLTENEVGFLNQCLDTIATFHPLDEYPDDVALFEQVEKKITDLYDEYCVRYSLSPALKKFHELYGTFGTENEVEQAKWEIFRDAFHAGFDHGREEGAQ